MNCPDLPVGFGREEPEKIVSRFAFLELADGRPARPDSGEAGEWPSLIKCEPDRWPAAICQRLVLAEAREGHDAAMFDAEPASPVRGFDVPDVGDARI